MYGDRNLAALDGMVLLKLISDVLWVQSVNEDHAHV